MVNLFDAATTETYTIVFEGADVQPPVLACIPDQARGEGQHLSFLVEASDPDGTIPELAVTSLPAGATFTDHGDGTGTVDWTPAAGQAGTYYITVEASDGELSASQQVTIIITMIYTHTVKSTTKKEPKSPLDL